MKALNDYIIIDKVTQNKRITKGGLELAESHTNDIVYVEGKVISVGQDVRGVSVGDVVFYRKLSGHLFEYENTLYRAIRQGDAMMVL